jgi:hypothetical protein
MIPAYFARQRTDGNSINAVVETLLNTRGNRDSEFIEQSEAAWVEIIVGLENELRPVPLTSYILAPRSVCEFLGNVPGTNHPGVSGNTFTS